MHIRSITPRGAGEVRALDTRTEGRLGAGQDVGGMKLPSGIDMASVRSGSSYGLKRTVNPSLSSSISEASTSGCQNGAQSCYRRPMG